MQSDITPEKTHIRRALPALPIPIATFPGCINMPDAIVLLKMRHAAVKDDSSCRLEGVNVNVYDSLALVAHDTV